MFVSPAKSPEKDEDLWPTTLNGTLARMGVVLEALTVWFNSQRYITAVRREEIGQLSCLQKLAMELCSPELASTDAQTTPSIDKGYAGAAASMQKAGMKKVIGRGTVSSETPKRQRDSTWELRKTPPKKSKSHGNNTALQADAVTQIPAAKPAMHESTSGPKGNWTKVSGRQKTRERIRSDAIAVSGVGDCSYSDILKMVKSDPTLKHLSSDVKSIRKATNGDLLIKMDTKPAHSSDELKDAVSKALGSRAVVKKLTETAQVEIWDLDELVSKEEVLESVKLALDDSTLNCEAVKSLRALKDLVSVAFPLSLVLSLVGDPCFSCTFTLSLELLCTFV